MTREKVKEMLPILQAYAEGKIIECRTKPSAVEGTDVPNDWTEMKQIEFWNNVEYRIKPPEPTYRPFKNAEECWAEMLKHQPFGWVMLKDTESGYYMLKGIASQVVIGFNEIPFSYKKVFEDYTFANGTPFGVKIEEE